MIEKNCRKCEQTLPLSEFNEQKKNTDGYQSYCRPCQSATYKEWRLSNREKKLNYNKEWRDNNPEWMRDWSRSLPSGVYKLTNTKNGKAYIGCSTALKQRFLTHKSKLLKGYHENASLQAECNEMGWDAFEWEVLHEFVPDAPKHFLREIEANVIRDYLSEGKELYNEYIPDNDKPASFELEFTKEEMAMVANVCKHTGKTLTQLVSDMARREYDRLLSNAD